MLTKHSRRVHAWARGEEYLVQPEQRGSPAHQWAWACLQAELAPLSHTCSLQQTLVSKGVFLFCLFPASLSAPNPCAANEGRGPCSHMCLISHNRSAACACPHLMKLSLDKKTCFGKFAPRNPDSCVAAPSRPQHPKDNLCTSFPCLSCRGTPPFGGLLNSSRV